MDTLRRKFHFPGMRILQFAFQEDHKDRFLPHNHYARGYLSTDGHDMPWTLIRTAMASVGDTAVHPMQDVLAPPTSARMNFPGQESGWWC